jgi:hypothetical protein
MGIKQLREQETPRDLNQWIPAQLNLLKIHSVEAKRLAFTGLSPCPLNSTPLFSNGKFTEIWLLLLFRISTKLIVTCQLCWLKPGCPLKYFPSGQCCPFGS